MLTSDRKNDTLFECSILPPKHISTLSSPSSLGFGRITTVSVSTNAPLALTIAPILSLSNSDISVKLGSICKPPALGTNIKSANE